MNLLLDTCAFLWLIANDAALSRPVREAIQDPANVVFVSPATLWEILIKVRLGRMTIHVPTPPERYFIAQRERHGLESLAIEEAAVAQLPKLPDLHRDPFDRILICQAIAHGMRLVSPDEIIGRYPIATFW